MDFPSMQEIIYANRRVTVEPRALIEVPIDKDQPLGEGAGIVRKGMDDSIPVKLWSVRTSG
jgi:hypothetical protein